MAVPTPNEFTYSVYRFDHALQNPKLVVEKLRGCCGQMDIQARDAKLWIPHNGRHSVEIRDPDGKELSKFGKGGKVKAEDFGGCCERKNMRVLANGDVLVAESGPPLCIKRFSASGKLLGVVALVNEKSECVRVTVEASPDEVAFTSWTPSPVPSAFSRRRGEASSLSLMSRRAPRGLHRLGAQVLALLLSAAGVCGKPPEKPEPALLVVMDPLAKELACACVQGFGRRDYRKLAAKLEATLKQRVSIEFSDDLAETLATTRPPKPPPTTNAAAKSPVRCFTSCPKRDAG
ncbi:MAG: SMP-30/Gluconolaconase/LRE-like region [Chthoniobacter sp.]|nr:SMP-30/Gluconolaconase/LRE-like region [Chthoniobacter sp.]